MIPVPGRPLAEMEDGFLRFWLIVNNMTAQIEMGTDARILVSVLRQELGYAMQSFYRWRKAKWMQGEQPVFSKVNPVPERRFDERVP